MSSSPPLRRLRVERDHRVVVVTLHRPEVMNAIDHEMVLDLMQVMPILAADPEVRAIIVTGAGKAFAAGADIRQFHDLDANTGKAFAERGQEMLAMIENAGKPVIAAINGAALGGGCELAMACTLRMAAESAVLGQPEINLGVMTGYAGSQRLARLVGKGVALDLLLTGRHVAAAEALTMGLVNRVVPLDSLMHQARALADELSRKPRVALQYTIEAVNGGLEMPFASAQRLEATLFGLLMETSDKHEGVSSFVNKRQPNFD